VRSILIDAISSVEEGGKDKREVAQLANAWARLKAGDVEAEKLKLKTQSAEEIAFEALGKEIRDLPETRAMFKKLCEVFEREKAAKAAGAKSGL
jgi:hypothetical protein